MQEILVRRTVSWITQHPADGKVRYGTNSNNLTNVAEDVRGSSIQDDIHYVNLSGLQPSTTYYFAVESGASQDDNGGQGYSFKTGATLSVPAIDSVYGKVLNGDGNPAANVLLYIQVLDNDGNGTTGESAWLAGMTDNTGYWYDLGSGGPVNLGSARSGNNNSYFSYGDGDQIRVEIQGGEDCGATELFDLGEFVSNQTSGEFCTINGGQAPDIQLSCLQMVNVMLETGWSMEHWISK